MSNEVNVVLYLTYCFHDLSNRSMLLKKSVIPELVALFLFELDPKSTKYNLTHRHDDL